VVDVVYPRACVACRRGSWPFCAQCWGSAAVLTPPGCLRCGRPLEASPSRCRDCPPSAVAWSRSAFLYEGTVRAVLMRIKFARMRSFAAAVAPWMLQSLVRAPPPGWSRALSERSFVVSWVPLGKKRNRERGYDQAEVLARATSELDGWPLRRLLDRVKETPPQARRSGSDRRLALRGAFRAVAGSPPRVILVDDVLTTGATAAECAETLLNSGAQEVGVLTAARSLGGPLPARCYTPAGLQPGSVVARETSSR
jgi:ComF family protein